MSGHITCTYHKSLLLKYVATRIFLFHYFINCIKKLITTGNASGHLDLRISLYNLSPRERVAFYRAGVLRRETEFARLRRDVTDSNVTVSWRFAATVETRRVREVGPLTHNILVQTPSVCRRRIVIPSRGTGVLAVHLQRRLVRAVQDKRQLHRGESRFVKNRGNLSGNLPGNLSLLLRNARCVSALLLLRALAISIWLHQLIKYYRRVD